MAFVTLSNPVASVVGTQVQALPAFPQDSASAGKPNNAVPAQDHATIRKAMTHQAITERGSGRTKHHLVHAHCARRYSGNRAHGPDQ